MSNATRLGTRKTLLLGALLLGGLAGCEASVAGGDGATDGGTVDAGQTDAGSTDAGMTDAGDAGLPPVNLALGATTASASSTFCGALPENCYSATRANDGDASMELGGFHSWSNEDNTPPHWVELSFDVPRTFGRVELYTTERYAVQDYQLEAWDGSAWTLVASVTGNTLPHLTHTFAPVTALKLRVLGLKGPEHQPQYIRINEVEVYAN